MLEVKRMMNKGVSSRNSVQEDVLWYVEDGYEVFEYLDKHHLKNQTFIDGVPFNPIQRKGFDCCPHGLRPMIEWEEWHMVPYIVPSHNGFHVRCLTGGAWDRSSILGQFDTLEEAVKNANQIKRVCDRIKQ